MEKISTDFFNYGTFQAQEADILKQELEKNGIPVKMLYPGTNIGRDAAAGAGFTAYKLLIRACDFTRAEEIRKNLTIEAIGKGTAMPYFPKSFITWHRIIITEVILFFVSLFVLGLFKEGLSQKQITRTGGIYYSSTDGYSFALQVIVIVFLIIGLITVGAYPLRTVRKWYKGKSPDEK